METNEVKNLKEAKELVELYRSITIENLKESSIEEITGFGSSSTCTLCTALYITKFNIGDTCKNCIYKYNTEDSFGLIYNCFKGDNKITYDKLEVNMESRHDFFEPTIDTLKAINDRADHIENLINKIEHDDKQK